MRMYDIIARKRDGKVLSKEEIEFVTAGCTDSSIPDYQLSAFLMAAFLNGLNEDETLNLTLAMADSGEVCDLSNVKGVKVDKHSTGGVGDKTTLIVAPIAAACGVKIAKMSGRGLGFTGGTIDKLESIPNLRTVLDKEEFTSIVKDIGLCIMGQTSAIAPADKKLYALRDVTATVDSIPLIASSIMSKKIASGADALLLDVKVGGGAFMKNPEEARKLAYEMVRIGNGAGIKTVALITDMSVPLGNCIGNSLEVIEAVEILKGRGDADLKDFCGKLAGEMICLAGLADSPEAAAPLVENALNSGAAFEKLREMAFRLGGDTTVLDNTDNFPMAKYSYSFTSRESGYITYMDAEKFGRAAVVLGAGRMTKEDKINYYSGIVLHKKTGELVSSEDVLATLYTDNEKSLGDAIDILSDAFSTNIAPPPESSLIFDRIE